MINPIDVLKDKISEYLAPTSQVRARDVAREVMNTPENIINLVKAKPPQRNINPLNSTPEGFLRKPLVPITEFTKPPTWEDLMKMAKLRATEAGMPPKVMIGQMALESGRGKFPGGETNKKYNNYFSYQSNIPGAGRYFPSPEASMDAYIRLISEDPRYAEAWKNRQDALKMLQLIKAAGYAEDPEYVDKITKLREWADF